MLPILKTRGFFPEMIEDFFGDETLAEFFGKKRGVNIPSVNVMESKHEFMIEIAAPGLEKEGFKIELHLNLLTISSDKEDNADENAQKFMRREFCYTCFKRSFTLPHSVDTEKIEANYKNGILQVAIPKKDEIKDQIPRIISIT